MSTDDISRYEFSKRIYSYQTRFNYPSPFTQTTKITHANIVKHDGYNGSFNSTVLPTFETANLHEDKTKIFKNHDKFISQQATNKTIRKNGFDCAIFEQNTRIDRLLERFKGFTLIKNAKTTIYFLVEEFYRIKIHNEYIKFTVTIEIWPIKEDVLNYYKTIKRENRNFESLYNFLENKDSCYRSNILNKIPQYDASTSFTTVLADATVFAKSCEADRIKFFCWHLAPNPIKLKIKDKFDEGLENFTKQIQIIWNNQNSVSQQENSNGIVNPPYGTVKGTPLSYKNAKRQCSIHSPNTKNNFCDVTIQKLTGELRYASEISKTPFAEYKFKTDNINRNKAPTITNRQHNFKCFMLVPLKLKGKLIGRNGSTIKKVSKISKTSIHIEKYVTNNTFKELKVKISGSPNKCPTAISIILHLIRKTCKNYPLKLILNSKNIAHIIGKKGNFVRKIKNVSKASFVRVFSISTENSKHGVLLINHLRNYNCIKAVKIALSKIHRIQSVSNSQAKCKMFKSGRKVNQFTVYEKVNKNSQTEENVIRDKVINNQNTADKTSKSFVIKCDSEKVNHIKRIYKTNENLTKTRILPKTNNIATEFTKQFFKSDFTKQTGSMYS